MSEQTRTTLKSYFETGDTPSQANFENLIDSAPNFNEDFTPKYKKVSVSSAEILQLNSSPKELVAAPGVGKVIIPTFIYMKYHYGSAAYATNNDAVIIYSNNTARTLISGWAVISGTTDRWVLSPSQTDSSTDNENIGLSAYVRTGNPTAGDGTLDIHLWYSEVTL